MATRTLGECINHPRALEIPPELLLLCVGRLWEKGRRSIARLHRHRMPRPTQIAWKVAALIRPEAITGHNNDSGHNNDGGSPRHSGFI